MTRTTSSGPGGTGEVVGNTATTPVSTPLRFGGREWEPVKHKLSNHYAQLTDEDLAYVPGAEQALFACMHSRTMESRQNLEKYLREECGCVW